MELRWAFMLTAKGCDRYQAKKHLHSPPSIWEWRCGDQRVSAYQVHTGLQCYAGVDCPSVMSAAYIYY